MQIYDSHVDTPSQLIRLRNIGIDNRYGHVDFPKLRRGGVGGSFFALYTPASLAPDAATRYALEMISAVYDAVDANPEYASLAFSPEEAEGNEKDGSISVFIGMENGSPIQRSLSLLRTFYRLGVSYLTLTHNGDNAIADSAAEGIPSAPPALRRPRRSTPITTPTSPNAQIALRLLFSSHSTRGMGILE